MDTNIGDYYERKRKEQHEAWLRWMEALSFKTANPNLTNEKAEREAYEKYIDAGNMGD